MNWLKWVVFIQIIYKPSLCIIRPFYHEYSKEIYSTPVVDEALFGYSVSYQPTQKRLIIGAPKANILGKVYSCKVTSNSTCHDMKLSSPIDLKGVKEHCWFGATVKAWDNHVMACAPRMHGFRKTHGYEKEGIFSVCYYNNGTVDSLFVMPLSDKNIEESNKLYFTQFNLHEHMMHTFGWSIDLPKNNVVIIGGPGMTTGRAVMYRINDPQKTIDSKIINFSNGTVMFNFGYGIASGSFMTKKQIHAISSPYGDVGKGKILFYNEKAGELTVSMVKTDENVGTIFGAALCFVNLGRPMQHLLVGAPAFAPITASASYDKNNSKLYEVPFDTGAVYIYVYEGVSIKHVKTIEGQQNGGYFGSAIVSVGDLNGDHMDEVAIAAPYEDEGQGAVYIYSGAELLQDRPTWKQRIKAEAKIPYLGLSLAVLQDDDENGCNELAIGMPGANKVMVVRCLATVTTSLHLNLPTTITDRTARSFTFKPCLHVTFPKKPETVNNTILITFQMNHPNTTFEGSYKHEYTYQENLKKGVEKYCKDVTVLLPKDGDYDIPISFDMTSELLSDPMEMKIFDVTRVLLSENSQRWTQSEVMAQGSDLTVDITSTMKNGYKIGSRSSEQVTVVMTNRWSVAYDACLRIRFDGGGVMVKRLPEYCSPGDHQDTRILCAPSTPLHTGNSWDATFELDTTAMTSNSEKFDIIVELYNRCNKAKGTVFKESITLKSNPSAISVKGFSNTGLFMNMTRSDLNFETPIDHIYSIMNSGYSTWMNIHCLITVPPLVNAQVMEDASTDCKKIDDEHIKCNISKVKGNNKVDIKVGMTIFPGSSIAELIYKKSNASILTNISVKLENTTISEQLTTVISLNVLVPLWIIIAASVVGFLILLLIVFALYECGFLRRKNKDKLEVLKKDIKRQTIIRNSMKLRQSLIDAVATQKLKMEDYEQLQNVSEENLAEDRRVVVPDDDDDDGCRNRIVTKADMH